MKKENTTKIKNIVLITIMFILIILGISTISNAKNWGNDVPSVESVRRGDTFSLSYTEYDSHKNKLFCIQHGRELHGHGDYHPYIVKRIISINGNIAENDLGDKKKSNWNAKLAYVIHNTSGEARRNAIWHYLPTWAKEVGNSLRVNVDWVKGEAADDLSGLPSKNEIDEYVEKVKDIDGDTNAYVRKKSTDEEPTAKLPTSLQYRDEFVKVGPFKLAFSPKLASMKIEGIKPNGDIVEINDSDIKFVTDGTVYEDIDNLKSNEEFSLLIPIEKRITKIINIEVQTKYTNNSDNIISAEIAILQTGTGSESYQNLAIIETTESGTGSIHGSLKMNLDISTLVDIRVIKVNSQNTSEKLPDVGFKLYHKQLKRWVRQVDGRTTYVENESSATEFKTNGRRYIDKGQKTITGLLLGDYTFVETVQPDNRFEMANKDFTLSSNKTTVLKGLLVPIEIPNDPIGGMLIEKVDESNESIKIPGVKFKLRNMSLSGSYQWVIQDSSGNISYIDEGRAKIFETNASGQASIPKLAVGEYEFKEIEVPEGYECASKYFTVTEGDVNSQSTIKYTIKNKPIGDGGILIEKVDEENTNIKIPGVKFKLKNTSLPGKQWVYKLISGEITYVDEVAATEFCTDQYGRAKINKLEPGDYEFCETEVPKDYECTTKYFTVTQDESDRMEMETIPYTITNKKKEKDPVTVIIEKVDSNNQNIKLPGVGFKLRFIQDNKWIYQDSSGTTTYVDSESSATTFYIESNGQKTINNLYEGDYEFKEVVQPYYGYECISKNFIVKSSEEATIQYFTITNKQEKIKLSGRVWIDKHSGKQNIRNDLYMTNYHYNQPEYLDDSDQAIEGLTVKLMKNGTVERTTVTASDGTYMFEDVLVDDLNNYYIEFEYNGLIYTNVEPHLDNNNGSKAIEGADARDEFNKGFNYIENGGSQTDGVTKNADKEIKHSLSYEIKDHIATLGENSKDINNSPFPITANTQKAGHNLYNEYIKQKNNSTTPIDCVEHNNLGIYEREQPDIALVKDIQNVKLAINGYEHIYEYAQRFVNQNKYGDGYEVGVKFGNKYEYGNMRYTRPIYKSDYMWENAANRSKELEVYITYKIQIKNQSTSLETRVNSIVDYYDGNYKLIGVGRTLSGNGTVGSPLEKSDEGNVNGYTKIIINTEDIVMAHQSTQDVYVQFKLSKEQVKEIITTNDKKKTDEENQILLNNVAEINSYTTFDQYGDIYAGIDKNSAPGNAVPGNKDTYEDDTDTAPGLLLETSANARQISGTVFLDETDKRLLTSEIREGNGQFKEDEDKDKRIKGVKVKLVEKSGTGKTYYANGDNDETGNTTNDADSKTDDNGNFTISGFIPGDYEIVYTWGRDLGGYNVQDYKGTVYDKEGRYDPIDAANKNSGNLEGGGTNTTVYKWYKEDEKNGKRYTDAIDNYATRLEIDEELKIKTYSSDNSVHFDKTMDSTTQLMKIAIEYDNGAFQSHDDNITYKYEINNIDFGIVRRAKQSVELDKCVKSMRVTLANGQVVSEVTIEEDENGNRKLKDEGENNHVTYMGPLNTPSNNSPGFVKVELDNELLQGAKIEATYEFKFKNKSEVDVINEIYYKFGSKSMPQTKTIDSTCELRYGSKVKGWAKFDEVVKIRPNHIIDYLDRNWGYEEDKNPNWTAITKEKFIEQYIDEKLVSGEVLNDANSTINDRIILFNKEWANGELVYPGKETTPISLTVSKTLTTTDDISLGNETEIIELIKGGKLISQNDVTPGGATIIQTPGSYVPGSDSYEPDTDKAETVIVTPSTGANLEFVIPITIAVIALVILGTGIVLIKKKVIDIKK